MANDLTGQNIQNTYQRVLHVGDDGFMYDGTGSLYTPVSASHEITTETSSSHAVSADTASFATNFTASGNISASGNILTSGEVSAIQGIKVVGSSGYKFFDDSDTYIYQQSANNITLYVGDDDILSADSTGVTIQGNFNATIDGGTW